MRPQQRRVWLLPWLDERNAVACATQVILGVHAIDTPESIAATFAAAHVIDAWMQKQPVDHDKAMLDLLRDTQKQKICYEMSSVLAAAGVVTQRALTNDLTSNAVTIRTMMETVMYAPSASVYADDAMAKWRFYDATDRKNMDSELRAAFEAHWLAGEYAAGYRFVGADWPWGSTADDFLYWEFDDRRVKFMQYGLINRNVQ